ncbi:hypothetical protein [Streptomyces sp. NPDC046909]|uniref:hypothetical protein n=1 Tax=Streptomyces sp. NPDC046909 TaxID=3155617 RepID=UPI0033E77543
MSLRSAVPLAALCVVGYSAGGNSGFGWTEGRGAFVGTFGESLGGCHGRRAVGGLFAERLGFGVPDSDAFEVRGGAAGVRHGLGERVWRIG